MTLVLYPVPRNFLRERSFKHEKYPGYLMRNIRIRNWLVAAGLVAGVASWIAVASGAGPTALATGVAFPQQVYAPYFETWTSDSLANTAALSGDHYLTMAFLQTVPGQDCTLYWSGDTGKPSFRGHIRR